MILPKRGKAVHETLRFLVLQGPPVEYPIGNSAQYWVMAKERIKQCVQFETTGY